MEHIGSTVPTDQVVCVAPLVPSQSLQRATVAGSSLRRGELEFMPGAFRESEQMSKPGEASRVLEPDDFVQRSRASLQAAL